MFSGATGDRGVEFRICLATDADEVLGPFKPFGLMPVEDFRIERVLSLMFVAEQATALRDRLCAAIIARLNSHPWRHWDQVRDPYRIAGDAYFVGIAVYLAHVDYTAGRGSEEAKVRSVLRLHSYDPSHVLTSSTSSIRLHNQVDVGAPIPA